jgi:glycosyltransferase involved in cell wall biosynthesis
MDIYGDVITIMQAANFHHRTNRGLPTTIKFNWKVLLRGDIFSVCGMPQKHMLVGELAMTGRLNYLTFGYEFVRNILPGAAPLDLDPLARESRNLLGDLNISKDDFVVLWAGGYNTWTDVQTLFNGLEWAIEQNSSIHFVSVGANTYQAKDNTYDQLIELIRKSNHRKHYHMLGWRPWVEIPQYYAESDMGINIDALHYETIYGTRTRLLEMISVGLPVITSLGSELSYILKNQQIAMTFEIQDWKSLGEHILTLSRNPGELDKMAKKSLHYARNDLSFASTMEPLREWVKDPRVAPDREFESNGLLKIKNLEYQGRAIIRQILWKLTGSDK